MWQRRLSTTQNNYLNFDFMSIYNPAKLEPKWQKYWQSKKIFTAKENAKKTKKFILVEFPYPSGAGLHMGHLRPYVAGDVYSRYLRMKGYEVMYPIGWDAFGLPAENYAIRMGVHPSITTKKNIANAKKQMLSWGLSFDWSREINTTDPGYYKWTQWLFLQFFKAGLAYEATGLINWCPKDKTGLANEEVVDGKCERCGAEVVKKELRQWYLKITAYAEKLLEGLKNLPEWPEAVKLQQENWIGKSTGAEIGFVLANNHNYIILPGWQSGPEDNFYTWLSESLKARGKSVQIYKYKSPEEHSEADIVADLLANLRVDENTVLIGHSLGCVMALKFLERFNKPVAKLVLAGGFITPKFKDKRRPFEKTFNWQFDARTVKKNVRELVILHDDTDPIVPLKSAQEMQAAFGGKLVRFTAQKPHIKGKEEPEVLAAVLPAIKIFTTRPDTIFGATYMVVAPEHPLLSEMADHIKNWKEVSKYVAAAKKKRETERSAEGKDKTGVELKGVKVVNPATGEVIPVWVADYVLWGYGTGAIMAVPAHDERDFEFAKKYHLPIKCVIDPVDAATGQPLAEIGGHEEAEIVLAEIRQGKRCYSGKGQVINSDVYDGLTTAEAVQKMGEAFGKLTVQYKLRDWVFSRQRYWGEPIPLIHCEDCGVVPVPDKDLPVRLPPVRKYEPTGTGESPLAAIAKWVKTKCPKCGKLAWRETNTMPQWAGSSWYWLRYADPKNTKKFADKKKLKYWQPVDVYFGGMEHTTLHLLYSRFWNLFLYDRGLVTEKEPYKKRQPHGIVLAADGEKMSKSRGNVVDPQVIVKKYGADTLRMYEMFLGPHELMVSWNDQGVVGVRRFLDRVWQWVENFLENKPTAKDSPKTEKLINRLIKKVTEDIEHFRFNTAISAFMEFHNEIRSEAVTLQTIKNFLKLLYPFVPHLAEELHWKLGGKKVLQGEIWPEFDETKIADAETEVVVQVNGKVRGKVVVDINAGEVEVKAKAIELPTVKQLLAQDSIKRIIYVKGRLINLVV